MLPDTASRVLSWLATAQVEGGGGIAAWHNEKGWAAPFIETTGYLIPTLIKWGRMEAAVLAGDWLLTQQLPSGAFPHMDGMGAIFDTAAVIEGLRVLYELTLDLRYDRALTRAMNWIHARREIEWDYPIYQHRAASIVEKNSTFMWENRERSHYLAYVMEGAHRFQVSNEHFKLMMDGLVIPEDGLLHFEYDLGWKPVGTRKDLCATLQVANLLWLRRKMVFALDMLDAVSKYVADDGGVPLDPARPNDHYSWSAKFFLDAAWSMR